MIENADKENSFLRLGDMISYEEEYVGLVSKICKEGIRYHFLGGGNEVGNVGDPLRRKGKADSKYIKHVKNISEQISKLLFDME